MANMPIPPQVAQADVERTSLARALSSLPPSLLKRMTRYLRAFARTGIVLDGLTSAKVARSTVEGWRERYPFFALAESEAREAAADQLERHLVKRATRGIAQPVFDKTGAVIGYRRTPSDNLLMFALKGARPGKYKEKLLDGSDLVTLLQRVTSAARRVKGDIVDAELIPPSPPSPEPGPPQLSAPDAANAGNDAAATVDMDERGNAALPAPPLDPPPRRDPARSLLAAVYAGARTPRRKVPNVPRETLPVVSEAPPAVPPARPAK